MVNVYRFFYKFTRFGEEHHSSCISFGETVTEAENKVLTEAKSVGHDTTGFEITSVRAVDTNRAIWGL